jgi:hypothetical protein
VQSNDVPVRLSQLKAVCPPATTAPGNGVPPSVVSGRLTTLKDLDAAPEMLFPASRAQT